jgi:large subunit ribosomal protein L30
MTYAVIRVRGTVNINPDIKHTLKLLNLTKVNHCILLEEKPSSKGMIQVAKDYITWGEINKDILSKLISLRGRLEGNKNLTNEYLKSSTPYDNIEKLSQAIIDKKFRYKDIPNVKPIFRLSPPKKGYEGIKRSFSKNGALGYRREEINKLIDRMI